MSDKDDLTYFFETEIAYQYFSKSIDRCNQKKMSDERHLDEMMATMDDLVNGEDAKTFVKNVQNANCQKTPHVLNGKYCSILNSKNYIRICDVSDELEDCVNDEVNFGDVYLKKILPLYDGLGFVNVPELG